MKEAPSSPSPFERSGETDEAISRIDAAMAPLSKTSKKNIGLRIALENAVRFDDPLTLRPERDFEPPPFEAVAKLITMSDLEARSAFAKEKIKDFRHKIREKRAQIDDLDNEQASIDKDMDTWMNFASWAASDSLSIERPDGSNFHKLSEGWATERVHCDDGAMQAAHFLEEPNIFVIEHNWSAAFDGAKDFDGGESPYPFDRCAFEMQIGGRRVIMMVRPSDPVPQVSMAFQLKGTFWCLGTEATMATVKVPYPGTSFDPLTEIFKFAMAQVRALCIALDAEVAVTSVVRAPHRLNSIRDRQGRALLSDYSVVNLARRSRVEALPSHGDEPSHHKRLHFRRGHWRHYPEHKTWIRWCLCGDPDLGFIDKHYRA